MVYSYTDCNPFCLLPEERDKKQFDKVTGTKETKYSKPNLILQLKAKGIKNPKGGTKKLQKMCRSNFHHPTSSSHRRGLGKKTKGSTRVVMQRGQSLALIGLMSLFQKGPLDFGVSDLKSEME